MDLLLHDAEEAARDRAEGERLAYVAATRARDVLVVPAIGDEVYDGGWLDPLMPAIYPPPAARRSPSAAAGCPAFPSKDTVLTRADGDPAKPTTVAPGMFEFGELRRRSALGARRSRNRQERRPGSKSSSRVFFHFGQSTGVGVRRRTPNAERRLQNLGSRFSDTRSRQVSSRVVGPPFPRPPGAELRRPSSGRSHREGRRSGWRRQADGRVPGMAGGPRRRRRAREGAERCCPHGDRARARWRASGTCRRRTD